MIRFNAYIEDVLSGRANVGKLIKLAVDRHIRDLSNDAFYFDEETASRVIKFFEILRHWKGEWAGERIKLESHQVFYIGQLFGWRLRENNLRRFRTSFKEVARKNAKTTECAGKAIYHLTKDGEPGAQVYFVATKEDQARIGFRDVQEIVRKTPELRNRLNVMVKSVMYGDGSAKPLGSDSGTQDGFDPSWGVVDEYHAHKTDEMLNILESGMGARRQPVIDVITTAGFKKEHPCYAALRKTSIEILKGIKQDDSLLALIYEMDEDDDWMDDSTWGKSNPNLGVSVKMDFLQNRFIKAKNEGGTKEVDFKTKNLNIWTDAAEVWIQDEIFCRCFGSVPDLTGKECYMGLDLASTSDMNSLALFFPGSPAYLIVKYYVPEDTVEQRIKDGADHRRWIDNGWLTVTPGNTTDYDYIIRDIVELADKYRVKVFGFDPWNARQTAIYVQDKGLKVEEVRQGVPSLGEPTKKLETMIRNTTIIFEANPILRWNAANVVIQKDSNDNIKMDKGKSTGKIDGMVASAIAVAVWMRETKTPDFNIRFL